MKISSTVLKLMLAGTSGLGLAAGAAFAMTPAPDAPIAVSDNAATPIKTQSAPVQMELVPPESLSAPVELGARVEVIQQSAAASDNSVTPIETEPTPTPTASPQPTATPTPAPDKPFRDPCPACGMG